MVSSYKVLCKYTLEKYRATNSYSCQGISYWSNKYMFYNPSLWHVPKRIDVYRLQNNYCSWQDRLSLALHLLFLSWKLDECQIFVKDDNQPVFILVMLFGKGWIHRPTSCSPHIVLTWCRKPTFITSITIRGISIQFFS